MKIRNAGSAQRFLQFLNPVKFPAGELVKTARGFPDPGGKSGVAALDDLQAERFGGAHPFPAETTVEFRDLFQIYGNVPVTELKQNAAPAFRVGFQQLHPEGNSPEQKINHGKNLPERRRERPFRKITVNLLQVPQINLHDVTVSGETVTANAPLKRILPEKSGNGNELIPDAPVQSGGFPEKRILLSAESAEQIPGKSGLFRPPGGIGSVNQSGKRGIGIAERPAVSPYGNQKLADPLFLTCPDARGKHRFGFFRNQQKVL